MSWQETGEFLGIRCRDVQKSHESCTSWHHTKRFLRAGLCEQTQGLQRKEYTTVCFWVMSLGKGILSSVEETLLVEVVLHAWEAL